jgi:hypothetical protein
VAEEAALEHKFRESNASRRSVIEAQDGAPGLRQPHAENFSECKILNFELRSVEFPLGLGERGGDFNLGSS